MAEIGFSSWLDGLVQNVMGGYAWALPGLIFLFCTLIGALLDSPWAMYAAGIPIALHMASSLGGQESLYMGAVCAAGLLGNEIAMGDIFFIGPMLGINSMAYYRAKFPYVILIGGLAFVAYLMAGFLLH
jgi:di/tricarboxylate transporter